MTMKYKGYLAGPIGIDDGILSSTVAGLNAVIHFQGETAIDLERAFRDSIDDYLDFCRERSTAPERPYSGKLSLRIKPEVHRKVSIKAEAEGLSVNQLIERVLEDAA